MVKLCQFSVKKARLLFSDCLKMKSGLLLLLFSLSCVVSQTEDSLDDLISKIFSQPTTETNNESRNSSTASCECVPYYLCNNGTIIKDGFGVIDVSIDDGPCDYLSVCCNPSDKLPEPISPPPDVKKPNGCGIRNPDGIGFRIKGEQDNEAQFGEFPWMVLVFEESYVDDNHNRTFFQYLCGASLIHPQVVLTSAHCVHKKNKHFKIRAGEWDTQTKNEIFLHQDRDVKTIIIHPEYYAGQVFNDVALLIVDSPLEVAENVDSVCLPKQGQIVNNTGCYASGWGKDVVGKKGRYQAILKRIKLSIVPSGTCQESLRTTRLGKHFELHESFICAGADAGQDTCKGDGGSPLVCPIPGHPGKYFQAGIVSWGIGCGENQIPSVYANVVRFGSWIDEQLAALNLEKSYYTY